MMALMRMMTMTAKKPAVRVGRDAVTGRFVDAGYVRRDPKTTVTETIKRPPHKK
jgi:hypothetical protein